MIPAPKLLALTLLAWFGLSSGKLLAQAPSWIWRAEGDRPPPAGERAYFLRSFVVQGKPEKVTLKAACAGQMQIWINGKQVAEAPELRQPVTKTLPADLFPWGENTVAVFGRTTADHVGFVLQLTIDGEYGKNITLQSDGEWRVSLDGPAGWNQRGFDASKWARVSPLGKLGDAKWGEVFAARPAGATPAEELTVPPGFKIELLRSAAPAEGSWVCMTVDDKGRLYLSPQDSKQPLLRMTLGQGTSSEAISRVDPIPLPVSGAMGMLWAYDSLYVSGNGPQGQAIYRLTDSNGDDTLDRAALFKKTPGGAGEHGAHAIVKGPDGALYIAMGNATPLIDGIAPDSPFKDYAEDDLLPRIKDPVATFFDNVKSPYGHILRTDAEGKKWELLCAGLRNAYDIDFSESGDLFTYDSDMEWDVGLPWYRPTRILHLVPGGEYGFREGSAKMPEYYPDTVPPVANIGLGSPTGVKFGTRSNWPGKWRSAFYAMDWTYGRILAIHTTASHARDSATFEDFVKGRGLPVTDLEFGPDGAMYFTVGGRGTQGGLYRVISEHPEAPPAKPSAPIAAKASWKGLAAPAHRDAAQAVVASLADGSATIDAAALRSLQLALARFPEIGKSEASAPLTARLSSLWQADPTNFRLVRDISQLLVALEWPQVVEPSLNAMEDAQNRWVAGGKKLPDPLKLGPQEESIWFARILCEVSARDFTAAQRERYFRWFAAAREFKGGNNFAKFIEVIRDRALTRLDVTEKDRMLALATVPPSPSAASADPTVPVRAFVKDWTVAELESKLGAVKAGRDFARGREIYGTLLCAKCHRFADRTEGNVGPDLTAVGGRFSAKDILEAIVDPSKAISEQYAAVIFAKKDGSEARGQIAEDKPDACVLYADPFGLSKITVSKADITRRALSPISLMPAGLLNNLQSDEILDLIAYLQNAGDKKAAAFQPTP